MSYDPENLPDGLTEIHTSGRLQFKRCRRKWLFNTIWRIQQLDAANIHLWFGTGFHFALEDYHGHKQFASPIDAFMAYYNSFSHDELPAEAEEMIPIAEGMFDHYINYWLKQRGGEFKTLYVDGKPQVEVDFTILLPEISRKLGLPEDAIEYRGTVDRVVEDSNGDLWVEDYKTAKRIDTSKLETDTQISVYRWAAESWFGTPFEGVLYTQFAKKSPQPPRVLKSGNLSIAKNQNTSHGLYREALLERYPDGKFPEEYVEMLAYLAEQESPEGDKFIRRDQVWRNEAQAYSEYWHIYKEILDMHHAYKNDLIYPNHTRDCSWDCDYRILCIAMDDGSDWKHLHDTMYEVAPRRDDLPWKKRVQELKEGYDG